ncbi:MAG: glycosyltransferase family 39 protein [Acidobacteria bacterium]|nr:glycosyltransferase family 39 protein [Acidobacteriota bacterium]
MFKNVTAKLGRSDLNVIAAVLAIKGLILFFGAQAYQIVNDRPLDGANSFLGIWNHWDAALYLKIAETGYTAVGDDRYLIVFFPFYPALVHLTAIVAGNYLTSAFIVSGLASVALGLAFNKLVKLDHSERTAHRAVLFLFIFPTAYFLHIPYTESLFLALSVGCFLAARKRYWLIAGALGALACLTRINGLILLPAIAFEVWEEYRETRQFDKNWLFLALIPTGFAGYLALNYFVAGDPTVFLVHQREHWWKYFRLPWEGALETFRRIDNPKPAEAQITGTQEFLFLILGLASTLAAWRYLRKSYWFWMAANWLLFVSTSFVISVPRYTLTLFPMFILMAILSKQGRWINASIIVWSILFLALFSIQFTRGWWAF